ncbi:MAG TPA: hypothetical protein VN784_05615 [Candidatus Limnocylindrales bacterium]|nr:hypothetical protein [Candidatus Limnocylindrales bacterium]
MPSIVWFGAGAVLSQLTSTVLFRLWEKLGILMPVAHWLDSHGGQAAAKSWFIFWIFLPHWLVAVVVGVLAGLFVKRHLMPYLLLFGVGFVLEPLAAYCYLSSDIPRFSDVAWYSVSIPVLLLCGILSYRRKSPPNNARGRVKSLAE